jgi:hypothetical protein
LKDLFRYNMEKYGIETKYTFWAIFYFLFILIPCLVVKIQYGDITSWTPYIWSYKCIVEISLLYDAVLYMYCICSTPNCILKVKKIHIKRLLTIDVSLTGASLLG